MPKINVEYIVVKPTSATAGTVLGAKTADINIKANDGKYYVDGVLSETDKSFASGTVKLTAGTLPTDIYCSMFGHTLDSETNEISCKTTDASANCGTGFIGTSVKSGIKSFRAIWLPQTVYAEPNDTYKCSEGTVSFQDGATLEGTVDADNTGEWKKEKTFPTLAEAKEWLNTKASIATPTEPPKE